jgi:exodeoxyribonuclease VII small subunit
MKKNINFEEALGKLEDIVNQLEKGELSLEASMKMFEEGNELVKTCLDKLNKAEKKIHSLAHDPNSSIAEEE